MPNDHLSTSDLEAVRAAVAELALWQDIRWSARIDTPDILGLDVLTAALQTLAQHAPGLLAMAEAAAREHEQLRIATQALDFIVEQNGALPSAEVVAEDALIQMSVGE